MSTITFDIEVAFQPEITRMAMALGVDEKKFCWHIDAAMRYVTHISYRIDNQKVVDLSLLDYKGSLVGDANEKELLRDFSKVYNQCDESIAHYGSKFDIRFLNTRIAKASLPRLKPIRLLDSWRILKDNFALPDNKLDTAIQFFKCPFGKPSLQWSLWRKVSLGDRKSHEILRHRCRYDVLSLDWIVRNKLRVFMNQSVNKSLMHESHFIDDLKIKTQLRDAYCPKCGVKGSLKREGYAPRKTDVKAQLSCRDLKCLGWSTAPIKKDGTLGRIQ